MKPLFGAVIAVVLLFLYAASVILGCMIVVSEGSKRDHKIDTIKKGPTDKDEAAKIKDITSLHAKNAADQFNSGMKLVMSTIGGLVSALVVSVLTNVQPPRVLNPAPAGGEATDEARRPLIEPGYEKIVANSTILYIVIWIVMGLASFVIGGMVYPDVLEPLATHGFTWLGVAVSAAYAYFGIRNSR